MNGLDLEASENGWQGENNYALFKRSVPISDQQIWQAFYQLHRSKNSGAKRKGRGRKLKDDRFGNLSACWRKRIRSNEFKRFKSAN